MKVIEKVGPPKKKRFNKNKKKAWRKKVKIQDVEEKLEEERQEERYGGPVSDKETDELMFLDLGDGSETTNKPVELMPFAVDTRPGKNVEFKKSKRDRTNKELPCHKYLKGLHGAKTPHNKQTELSNKNASLKQAQAKAEQQEKKTNVIDRLEKKLISRQAECIRKKAKPKVNSKMVMEFNMDAWDSNRNEIVVKAKEKGVEDSFLHGIVDFYSKVTKKRSFNVPSARYKKTSNLPSVQIPEPGQSYNPSFEDHQVLLEKALRQQVKKKKEASSEKRIFKKYFPTQGTAPTEETWIEEMAEGLPKAGEDDDELSSDEEQQNEATVITKRVTEKKTEKKRKKEKAQKMKERRTKLRKEKRIREADVFRVKTFNREITKLEKRSEARKVSRIAYYEQKKSKPQRIGKTKYQPEDIVVSLGSDLRGSLRNTKAAVSLLDERLKSFERRNMVTPGNEKTVRRKLEKKVMKREHKDALREIEAKLEEDI